MGLYDREYSQDGFRSMFRSPPPMRMMFPSLTAVVKWLLVGNIGLFLISVIIPPLGAFIYRWFQLDAGSLTTGLQLWRLVTYQFLHNPDSFGHILFNMLGLFFLGPALERHWGSRRFLMFYLGCGVAGGLFYLLLVAVNFLSGGKMIGASGAILGMLAACAILFPHFVVFIFVFPVPIRIAAVTFTAIYLVMVLSKGANAGGDAAHLGGMAAGAFYVLSHSWRARIKLKMAAAMWEKKITARRDLQLELDRILQKVHDQGLHSLTSKEKKVLKQATKAEQMRDGL